MKELRWLLIGILITFVSLIFAKWWSPDYESVINTTKGNLMGILFFIILIGITFLIEYYFKSTKDTKDGGR